MKMTAQTLKLQNYLYVLLVKSFFVLNNFEKRKTLPPINYIIGS